MMHGQKIIKSKPNIFVCVFFVARNFSTRLLWDAFKF